VLKKENKIQRSSFPYILKHGKNFSVPHFTLKTLKNNTNTNSFSIVISKKVLKNAVDRNSLKRRGYHVIHNTISSLSGGNNGVIFVKKGAHKLSYRNLKEEVLSLFKKAKLYKS